LFLGNPSPYPPLLHKERGNKKKEGLTPLLNTLAFTNLTQVSNELSRSTARKTVFLFSGALNEGYVIIEAEKWEAKP